MFASWVSTWVPEPGARRRLGVATGVYNIGTGMFLTSSVLYFTEGLGLSVAEVGLWLAVAGLIGLFAGVPMGRLADRRGPRSVAAWSLVVLALTMVGYVFVTTISMFVAVTVVELLATSASRASRGGLIRRVGGEGAAAYRSQLRAIENAGVGLGAVVGALALTLHTLAAYQVLFLVNAVTFLIGAWVCAKLPHFAPVPAPPGAPRWVALRDRPFIAYTILNGVMSLQYSVITFALPLWIAMETSAPRWMVGAVLIVNTVGVVALQVWVGKKVKTVRQGAAAMRVAGLVFLIACVATAVASDLMAWAAVAVLLAAVAIHSVGEMCHAAAVFALSYELAPAHAQSEYVGLQDMGLGAAFAVAPAVLGALCLGMGQAGWLLLGGLLTAAGVATVPIVGWAVRTRSFALTPDRVPVQPSASVAGRLERSFPQTTVRIHRSLECVVFEDNSRFVLDRDCVVGRDPHDSDAARSGMRAVRIDVRDNGISRAHLEIRRVDGRVFVVDRQSRNGVTVRHDEQEQWIRIAPWRPTLWPPGTSVRIGSRIMRLQTVGPRPAVRKEPIPRTFAAPSRASTVRIIHADWRSRGVVTRHPAVHSAIAHPRVREIYSGTAASDQVSTTREKDATR